MQLGGLDIEDAAIAVGRESSRLLGNERQRVGFVQQTELAARGLFVGGIAEHATTEQVAMEVGHERAHVAHVQCLLLSVESAIAPHERAGGLRPILLVRVVHRQISRPLGDADVGMRQQELANGRIEREAVRPLPRGVHHHGARAVEDVAGRHLTAPRLQHVLHLATRAARDLPEHGEDRTHGHIHVDVRRAVERIEEQHVLAVAEAFGDLDDVGLFLRRHGAQPPAVIERLDDDFVGDDVELLLHFALHILAHRRAEDIGEAGAAHLVGDHLAGERHVVEDAGQFTRRLREHALLLDDEALDGDDRRRSMLDHGRIPGG